ncbi:hypothetical protein DB44_CI00030 [Candidatus Protochlamydia amoebophila]|uniref:Transposase DDE domain-containing protein n=1 Tax=Candidatus Protochlamydia amoebophila TaxID=362787 RepID=A0A0C1JPH3_9BACT|nr:hypothetical protein DB44_CI00030 [Candidatus Protochlamydia amoebophila]
MDAFPVSVCRNIRIQNCRIYRGKEFRGYNASKRDYFYGLKVTVLASQDGCPFRVILCSGREHLNTWNETYPQAVRFMEILPMSMISIKTGLKR